MPRSSNTESVSNAPLAHVQLLNRSGVKAVFASEHTAVFDLLADDPRLRYYV